MHKAADGDAHLCDFLEANFLDEQVDAIKEISGWHHDTPQAYYFDRDDVAYSGFSAFFKKNSDEERDHAEKFIKYQNRRGGKVVFQDVARPNTTEWGTPLEAMEAALELEKTVSYH